MNNLALISLIIYLTFFPSKQSQQLKTACDLITIEDIAEILVVEPKGFYDPEFVPMGNDVESMCILAYDNGEGNGSIFDIFLYQSDDKQNPRLNIDSIYVNRSYYTLETIENLGESAVIGKRGEKYGYRSIAVKQGNYLFKIDFFSLRDIPNEERKSAMIQVCEEILENLN